jgi:hypothetical protein
MQGIKECTRAVIKKDDKTNGMKLLVEGNGLQKVMATKGASPPDAALQAASLSLCA